MSRIIVKLKDRKHNYYLEWSTVVDAPVTNGMSLDEFKRYYKREYGKRGTEELKTRLPRVETGGCSSFVLSLEDVLDNNKAGENEKHLTKKEILKKYCLKS